jgi:REP element-mobilizing transposase RayT
MQKIQPLENGFYYHIYNRGINSCNIFKDKGNYEYFLHLFEKHVSPIADIYAWVLMPNHFHFLVRIKDLHDLSGFENLTGHVKPPHQYFSNLFNAYSKAYNKQNKRHGSLFERPFKRKLIDSEDYLKRVLIYIHNNPVHHGFTEHTKQYLWSSYLSFISKETAFIQRDIVIDWFENLQNFKILHKGKKEFDDIDEWLGL